MLGSFGTGSGPIGANVADSPAATKAWVADVNARGGLNGHPVRVLFADDAGDPQRALAAARRMVENDHAIAFLSTYGPTTVDAVVPYLEQRNIPLVGTECGSAIADASPMIFVPQVGCDHGTAWSFLLTVLAQSKARKMAALYCREAATCPNQVKRMKEFIGNTEMKMVYEAQISLAQPDFTAEMISARNAGAEVVALVSDSATMIRVIRAAKRQNYTPLFSGTWSFNVDSFAKTGGPEVEGVLSVSATAPYATSPIGKPYLAAMARYQPGAPIGGFGMNAWTHGKLLERIASRFGATVATGDVLDGLYSVKDETLGGLIPPITFNKGPHKDVNLCSIPLRMANGRFEPFDGDRFVCPKDFTK